MLLPLTRVGCSLDLQARNRMSLHKLCRSMSPAGRKANALAVILTAMGVVQIATLSAPSNAAAPLQCPQPRFTGSAPQEYLERGNPYSAEKVDFVAMEKLYGGDASPAVNCAICHGKKGDGRGPLSDQYMPPPRNFACAKTVAGVPDGQLFWIIRFGSPQTAMPPHPSMSEEDVWKMVLYLRRLAK